MRTPGPALILASLIGASCAIAFFIFNPVYVDVCEGYGATQKCAPTNILNAAISNLIKFATHAEFWTAIGTLAIAAFTFTLKRSTDRLWDATKTAAKAAQQATEHIPRVERAYIVGGGPIRRKDINGALLDPQEIGWLSVGNYGKTAAILKKIEWGFCDESLFPRRKPVSQLLNENLIPKEVIRVIEREDVYQPGRGPEAVAGGSFSTGEQNGKIFFGRFTYSILFDDKEHFSTFKLKIWDGGSFGLPGSYSDWK